MSEPEQPDFQAYMALAHALADIAGAVILPHFRTGLAVDHKGGVAFDPVTAADRDAETAIRQAIAAAYPSHGIVGEEFGDSHGSSKYCWIIDPIDGTRAFISGATTWGTLIGLDAGDGPVLGLIDQPYTRERFMGGPERAEMWRDGTRTPLATRACARLDEVILYSTFPEVGTSAERAGFEAVRDRVRLTRYGFDCYAYALVALGQVDLVVEAGLYPYDIAAPQAVIEAAGGVVTDWRGGSPRNGGRVLAAGDARVHAAALEILSAVS